MEYLVIVGLVLVLLIPLTILYAKYSSESSYAVTTAKVDSISNEIVAAANQVNVYGTDTQVKLRLSFPDGIQQLQFLNNEIIFTIRGKSGEVSEIVKVADINFQSGTYSQILPGSRDVIVKSLGTTVDVQFACKTSADCNLGQTCRNSICGST